MNARTGVVRRWLRDLALGFRLAVGGSRNHTTSWTRLTLGALGIALAVAVLLGAASASTVLGERDARQLAQSEDPNPRKGVKPTYIEWASTDFRDTHIRGKILHPVDETSPLPPGVRDGLVAGEMLVSAELRELLAAPEGELLRPRFSDYRIVGTIGQDGVVSPADLTFVAMGEPGTTSAGRGERMGSFKDDFMPAYGFGHRTDSEPMPFELVLIVALGSILLLVPLMIFVVSSSRIAGAERDRRLAALRLVGGDARQVRRIAAGESLVPAAVGVVAGVLVFLAVRPLVAEVRWWGVAIYPHDIEPTWWLAVLILLFVPLLSVAVTLVAMRRTVIEPLGVMRQGKPVRRRLWWRLVTLALGVVLLVFSLAWWGRTDGTTVAIVVGSGLLVLGIAMLLPWVVEAVIRRARGGSPALQLATRRLQVDSGTAARVISGIVVVLTGAVALLLVLGSADDQLRELAGPAGPTPPVSEASVMIQGDPRKIDRVLPEVERLPGVRATHPSWELLTPSGSSPDPNMEMPIVVGDCFALQRMAPIKSCADGDAFLVAGSLVVGPNGEALPPLQPGDRITVGSEPGAQKRQWTVPKRARAVVPYAEFGYYRALVTPGAVPALEPDRTYRTVYVEAPRAKGPQLRALAEHVRNAVGLSSMTYVSMTDREPQFSGDAELFQSIKSAIYAGSVVVLFLAALSVLVLGIEQVRERRRALAAISAGGVGFGTLARSLLWQNAIPLCIGVALSVGGGTLLAYLFMRMVPVPLQFDWLVVGSAAGLAAALVLFVTLLSLPALRTAVSVKNLRTE